MLFVSTCCIRSFRELTALHTVAFVAFWTAVVSDSRLCANSANDAYVLNSSIVHVVVLWRIRSALIFGFNPFMIRTIIFCPSTFISVAFWETLWMNSSTDSVSPWVKFKRSKAWCDTGLNRLMNAVWIAVNEALTVESKALNHVSAAPIRKKGR